MKTDLTDNKRFKENITGLNSQLPGKPCHYKKKTLEFGDREKYRDCKKPQSF